ncbi:MAG: hypothetical protein HRT43_11535, partial [Campylobacteraceae bacterium]|nr:hypothetical protein [Campylobacteraceae bacterium]
SESIQENNTHVKPSSSRDDVEVDKIFKLLQEAKEELKNKNTFNRDRKERIDQIISDIPRKDTEENFEYVQKQDAVKVQEEKENDDNLSLEPSSIKQKKKSKKDSHLISYLLLSIVFILLFLLFDNNNIIKLASANEQIKKEELKFSDLAPNLQNEYIPKHAVIQTQEQTKDLIEKSKLLIEQNRFLEEKIKSISTENGNKLVIEKEQKVKNNRNLLKELTAFKNEQAIYSNKVATLNIKNTKNKVALALLENQNKLFQKKVEDLKKSKEVKVEIKTKKEVQKETTVDKYQKVLDKEVFPAIKSTSTDYKILKCYDLVPGQFYLSSKCKKDISTFASSNSNASRFEIIGVVDQIDFTTLYKEDVTSHNALELQKYNAMGLARYRVLETSWFLSTQLKDIILTPVNYTITSKKTNRGSIIRAYYK